MFAVGLVSKYMQQPCMHHFGTMKHIMHYISGTIKLGLKYEHSPKFKITSYIDSDWGVSIDDWRSTTSWVFNLWSGAIAWALKKQEITALSSTEAEYIAATSVVCQAVWLRRLLANMRVILGSTTIILAITCQPSQLQRTRRSMEEPNTLMFSFTSFAALSQME